MKKLKLLLLCCLVVPVSLLAGDGLLSTDFVRTRVPLGEPVQLVVTVSDTLVPADVIGASAVRIQRRVNGSGIAVPDSDESGVWSDGESVPLSADRSASFTLGTTDAGIGIYTLRLFVEVPNVSPFISSASYEVSAQ